jgi:hypothetical protein
MRRIATVVVTTEGRDKGKTFKLTEMSADAAERWALRALLLMANAGAKLPEGTLENGMAGIAATLPGLIIQGMRSLAGLTYTPEVEALLSDMMACVQFVPPGVGLPPQTLFQGDACQIEEVRTRLFLRTEVLKLHMDPSLAGALST